MLLFFTGLVVGVAIGMVLMAALSLASNYVIVHRNLEWKRRRPDSEQKE